MPRRSPKTAARYDVGHGEMLTIRQIALILKTTPGVVRSRVQRGWKGEQLLTPVGQRGNKGRPRTQTAVYAYTLALKFGRRWPSTREILDTIPVDDTTAMYWRAAIRDALIKLAEREARRK